MTYIYRYDLAAVIISLALLISFFRKKTINTRVIKSFEHLIITVLISSLFDIISIFCIDFASSIPNWVLYTSNIIYQVTLHTIPITLYYCFYFIKNQNTFHKTNKRILLSLPYFYALLLICTTPFTKFFFYFDQNYNYLHGPLFFTIYIESFFYIIITIVAFINARKYFSNLQKFTIIFYMILCIIAIFVQLVKPTLMLLGISFSISIMVGYLILINPSAFIDSETEILNRNAFVVEIGQRLELKNELTILAIQLEGTEIIKHTIGRISKAKLLKNICLYFHRLFNKRNVYRLSENKIIVILSNDNIVRTGQINAIKSRFLEPFYYNDIELTIPVLMNIISCPKDASTIEDVLDLIDNIHDGVLSHDMEKIPNADTKILEKKRREREILHYMEKSMTEKDIEIVYQPILNVNEKKCHCAEALIRLKTNSLGFIRPEEFIPLAEQNGMIQKIGNYVFKSVCRFIIDNNLEDKGIHHIHINLSVIQCVQENLYNQLFDIMDDYHINYNLINLELTEASIIAAENSLQNNMSIMAAHNITFSLDDYGTGNSNISYLTDYPFSIIKLDKSIIWKAMNDERAKSILLHSIKMIKDLNLKVLAEGVETEQQALSLTKMGVDYIQGFNYSYPLEEKDFLIFLN